MSVSESLKKLLYEGKTFSKDIDNIPQKLNESEYILDNFDLDEVQGQARLHEIEPDSEVEINYKARRYFGEWIKKHIWNQDVVTKNDSNLKIGEVFDFIEALKDIKNIGGSLLFLEYGKLKGRRGVRVATCVVSGIGKISRVFNGAEISLPPEVLKPVVSADSTYA